MSAVIERLPERARTPAMARAIMAPSAILLAGAGTAAAIVVGAPLVGAAAVGALVWAGKVALGMPRRKRRPDMNPAQVKEPWRSLVRQTIKSEERFKEAVAETRAGPDPGHAWPRWRPGWPSPSTSPGTSPSGATTSTTPSAELDIDGIGRELATCEADLAIDPDRTDLQHTADALRGQLESARRLAEVARDARDRLRRLNAQLNEAVARAVELSLGPSDVGALQPLGSDVDGLVSELEALRLALDDAGRSAA